MTLCDHDVSRLILQKVYNSCGDADNEWSYASMGIRGIRKISVLSSQLCCKPESALKNCLSH